MTEYKPDDLLPLSGIQHFAFCRRQWALIHVEKQWVENVLTAEGRLLHKRADDPYFSEVREGEIITRAMPVASYQLGLVGVCDVVVFSPSHDGVQLSRRAGKFLPTPVEYKRGKQKLDDCDEVQICAQAMCLEEMLLVTIPQGYLYYGEVRHRTAVAFTEDLRGRVRKYCREMHDYHARGYTPKVKTGQWCRSCSLQAVCLPGLIEGRQSVSDYILTHLNE